MTVSPGRVRAPWPLQVIIWGQFAAVVADVVQVLVAAHGRPGWTALAGLALNIALVVFLMLKLRAGRRWARSLIAVIAAITLLIAVARLFAGDDPPLATVVFLVVTLVTLVLLYLPPSNAFFRRANAAA
ncbi:hypothetical protein AB0L41_07295 [Amycolatopsis mediterranei]|uniref:hypothetical protein n=1 Tax=Amycolatopsis mediterranei TaxID=33910 RepID=UPI003420516A